MCSRANGGIEPNDEGDIEEKKEAWRSTVRVMNERFVSRLDENVFEGVRDEKIHHGLRLTITTVLHKTYMDVCFCGETKEYLILERGVQVHRYSMQGKQLLPSFRLEGTMTFTRMIWCSGANCLACYDPELLHIWMLDSSCVNLQAIKCDYTTKAVYYEPTSNEIVVVGTHQSSLVASYLTTLYVAPLNLPESGSLDAPVEFVGKRAYASRAPITIILFHESSSWIVTGDQQGNIVAWSLSLECMMSHIGAHENRVSKIVPHPSICGFLTYSYNSSGESKLQVWCCNFYDKVEVFCNLGEIDEMAVNESAASIVVMGSKLKYFTMYQMYSFYAPLSAPANFLSSSRNPMYPMKVVVASNDNSVRLLSNNGKQLTVQILPKYVNVLSAVYCGNRNELYTIMLRTGEILISNTDACPMKYRKVFVNDGPEITCVTVYEYFDEIRDENRRHRMPRVFYPIRIRIIAGDVNGNLIVINEASGKHENVNSAHEGAVMQLQQSVASGRIVSVGQDKCVKVWRVFADLSEPLVLFYTICFVAPITRIACMGSILCMIRSSKNNKHELIMEDTSERVRLEHQTSKDHTDVVLDMIASEPLALCATSSSDKTIRIWDHENSLLKILEINTCAWKITFSSVRSDIVFSAGRHLFKITHESYLPPKYRAKIVAEHLDEEAEIETIPEDVDYRVYDNEVDRDLMLHPTNSTPLAALDVENSKLPRVDILIKQQVCSLITVRDEDIKRMRDNLQEPLTVLSGDRALMTEEDWDKYVSQLFASMTRAPGEVPDYDFHNIREKISMEGAKSHNARGVFHMLYGLDVDEVDHIENLKEIVKSSNLPLKGSLPNSILYKPKEEEEPEVIVEKIEKRALPKYKYPPEFYPETEHAEIERRISIRLSMLMGLDPTLTGEEEAA